MKDLSREEELRQQIHRLQDINENRKWMRTKKTLFVLSATVYLAAFMTDSMNSIQDYLVWIVCAPVAAVFIMFVSVMVTLYIFSGALSDEKYVARLQGELDAIQSTRKDV